MAKAVDLYSYMQNIGLLIHDSTAKVRKSDKYAPLKGCWLILPPALSLRPDPVELSEDVQLHGVTISRLKVW